jgi:mannosyltransferase
MSGPNTNISGREWRTTKPFVRRSWSWLKISTWPLGLILALPLLLGVATRLWGIGVESLWLDEATSLILAHMDLPGLVQWTAQDIHPPLYYILLHYWIVLVQYAGQGQSEAIIRGLSALAGVLNIGVIYLLGQTLFERRTGLYAALLLALSPLHIWYSQEARMYTWVTLLVSTSVLLALRAWTSQRWLTWLGYIVVTTAALYTHYYAVFGIMLENLFLLYLLLRPGRTPWHSGASRALLWRWLGSQAAVFVLYLPWLPTFLLPITVGGGGWVALGTGKPSLAALAQTVVLYMVGTGRALYPALIRRLGYFMFAAVLLVGLVPIGGWLRRFGRPWAVSSDPTVSQTDQSQDIQHHLFVENEALFFTLAYWVIPPGMAWIASQLFKPMYSARYMLPFLIPFIILVARGIRNIPWAAARQTVLAALVVFMGVGVVAQVSLQDKPDWRGFAANLTVQAQPGDLLVFMPGWHVKPFDYYAHGALETESDLPVPIPQYGDKPFTMLDEAMAGHARIWLVWETEHYTDPQGAIYAYLSDHAHMVQETDFPLVGKLTLYENPGWAGRP